MKIISAEGNIVVIQSHQKYFLSPRSHFTCLTPEWESVCDDTYIYRSYS